MQTAEYNPKRVQDQQDVDPSSLFVGATLVWNGIFFTVTQLGFTDLAGNLGFDQLPPGTIATLDSIGEDALYFYDDAASLPKLINSTDAAHFLGLDALSFSDITGTLSLDQLPSGTIATLDSIGEDALYFYDDTASLPKLINSVDAAHFLGIDALSFSDIGGTLSLDQLPPGTIATLDSIGADALYFYTDSTATPSLIGATAARAFLSITGSGVVDGQQLFDGSHVLSLDAGARALYEQDGTTSSARWGDAPGWFRFNAPIVQFDTARDANGAGLANLNLLNRKLYASDGTTEVLDYSGQTSVNLYSGHAANLYFGYDVGSVGFIGADYVQGSDLVNLNEGPPSQKNIDLSNRKLYNPNGTTVAIDYGTNGAVFIPNLQIRPASTSFSQIVFKDDVDSSYAAKLFFFGTASSGPDRIELFLNRTTSHFAFTQSVGGSEFLKLTGSGKVLIPNLGSSDPSVADQIWNNAGLLVLGNFSASSARTALGLAIGTNVQAWDADLSALAALSGTNNIYYRSASNTWSSVTIGSGLSFAAGTLSASGGGGTVTNTGGNLTSNSVVLGAGTVDTKVVPGIISDGTSKLTLGVAGTSVGAVVFNNATSGSITVQPATGALSSRTLTLPAETGTLATQAWTTNTGVPGIVSGTGFWHSTSGIGLEGSAISQTGTTSVVLADSPSLTTKITLTRTALGATTDDGLIIANSTAAANNAQQVSPQIRLTGRGWDSTGGGNKLVEAHLYLKPVQGAGNPTAQLIFETAINSGSFGNAMTLDSSGNLTISGLTASALVATDGSKTLSSVTIGSGLTYSGGTLSATGGGGADNLGLTPTAVKTSAYTAVAGDFIPVDTTSGGVTVTLPTAPADKSVIAIKHVIQGGTNTVTINTGGSDVFNKAGGSTSGTLSFVNQAFLFQYKSSSAIWYIISDDLPLAGLDLRFQPLDSDLTTIAGLTATTDNFIVSVSSAWASRTPSQVKTTLGLVIGTNVQAWDADLDTWATITPGTGVGTFLGTPSSANLRAALTDELGSGAALFDGATLAQTLTFATNSTSLAPISIPAGTLKTTPADGDIEADGDCIYACTDAGNRGYVPVRHFIRADSTVTYANDTNPHAIFTTPANGRLTLETGCYRFVGQFAFSSMSATSGNAKIDILGAGTATTGTWLWMDWGQDGASGTANAIGGQWNAGATGSASTTGANCTTAGTATTMGISVMGTFEVTVAGTLIPTVTQNTAAAAVLTAGSYLEIWRIGNTSVTSVGQWD